MYENMLVFDIESNGIRFQDPEWWKSLETIHCLVITNRSTGETYRYNDGLMPIEDGVKQLMMATLNGTYIGGQNVHGFDIPALQYMFPWFKPDRNFVRDSKVESEMWYPSNELRYADVKAANKYGADKWIPSHLYGKHSLEAWGLRIGCPKDEYKKWCDENGIEDPWGQWSEKMEDYCAQDVDTNIKLFEHFESKFNYETASTGVWLENRVAPILLRQKAWGIRFNVDKAVKLNVKLTKRHSELTSQLEEYFGEFYMKDGRQVVPKKTLRYKDKLRPDLTEGAPYTKVKLVQFNPASRQHIWMRLKKLYGWKPVELTDKGDPKVDEDVLKTLNYPPVPMLIEYLTVEKRLGQLVNGKGAWMYYEKNGRIHGNVKQNGTRTTRASHTSPNLGQVPKVSSPYGAECRDLFEASEGRVIVGCDQSGIELRALAHFLGLYDGGAYARECVAGDVHSRACEAIHFNSRDNTKTAEYAFLYGAQNPKLGRITYDDFTPEQRKEFGSATDAKLSKLGAVTRRRLQRGIYGLEPLLEAVGKAYKRGWMRALDGRRIAVPAKHSALNTLCQHLGGELSKVWMVLAEDLFIAHGLQPANEWVVFDERLWHVIQILWVHDELQEDTHPEYAEQVGQLLQQAAKEAGEFLKLRVPVDAEYKIGGSWKDTH